MKTRTNGRNEVEQPGHRRGAGEPEDRDRAHVVDRPERRAQLLVREERQGSAVGAAPDLEVVRFDQQCRDDAGQHQIDAHDDSGCQEELASAGDPALGLGLGVIRRAFDLGHHRDTRLEAGQAEGKLGEHDQSDPHDGEPVVVLGHQKLVPVAEHVRVLGDLDE
jgi:hypothetical protein